MIRLFLLSALSVFILGCSNTKYCEREQDFHGGKEGSVLRAPDGLTVPEPDPSFVVPEVSAQAHAAALTEGRPCLEIPPRLETQAVDQGQAG